MRWSVVANRQGEDLSDPKKLSAAKKNTFVNMTQLGGMFEARAVGEIDGEAYTPDHRHFGAC